MRLGNVNKYSILDMVRNAQQKFYTLFHTFIKRKDQNMLSFSSGTWKVETSF